MQKKDMKKDKLYAFMINDLINFNIDELVTFIEDEFPSCDIYNVKRTYIHIQPNGANLKNILSKFVISKVDDDEEEVKKCIKDNISVFFDITNKSEGVYIVEKMESN